jgi:hypothetical protein
VYTLDVFSVGQGAWHIEVRELPQTWTVAFELAEIEQRARQRISLDTGLEPDEFDVTIHRRGDLMVERRSHRRD